MTPKATIIVGGLRRSARINAIVDTGFNGYVCIPIKTARNLGLELIGSLVAQYADGSEKKELIFSGWVEFLSLKRSVEIEVTDGEALIGTGLLANCDLSIDFVSGDVRLTRKARKGRSGLGKD